MIYSWDGFTNLVFKKLELSICYWFFSCHFLTLSVKINIFFWLFLYILILKQKSVLSIRDSENHLMSRSFGIIHQKSKNNLVVIFNLESLEKLFIAIEYMARNFANPNYYDPQVSDKQVKRSKCFNCLGKSNFRDTDFLDRNSFFSSFEEIYIIMATYLRWNE